MRSLPLLSLAVASASAGHVSVGISKSKVADEVSLTKRDGTINLDILNNITGAAYYAEFQVGTPGQTVSLILDTGSSDTWVNSKDADLCNDEEMQAKNGYCLATFDSDKSKTFKMVQRGGFDIDYLDGRNVQGDYFQDTITIGDMSIKGQQLGLGIDSDVPSGIMGLGFNSTVAAKKKYPTVVDNMVSQGLIDTAVFSLYLNNMEAESGTVLFGAIDKHKFVGELATLPIEVLGAGDDDAKGNITTFVVAMEGFEVKATSKSDRIDLGSLNADAILDSGSTISLLPDDQVESVWKDFGVLNLGTAPLVDCAYGKDKGKGFSFDFKFKGKTINVPITEMVVDSFASVQEELQAAIDGDSSMKKLFKGWDGVCMFGIGPISNFGIKGEGVALLGDTFLRSAYVVYDLANEQIGLAQSNPGSTKTDIVEINANSTKLPSVSGVSEATNSRGADEDDDSAANHLIPAMSGLLVAVAAAMSLL